MKEKTKFMAFSTQKGGAGKTTLTVLTASYLYYIKGFNVAVIDCDYPQYSIVEMRERDLKLAFKDEHYKRLVYERFIRLQKKAYPIVENNTKEALAGIDYLLPQGDFDYVFLDPPGMINNEDLVHSLTEMDYLVAPISTDRVVMENTLNYAVVVEEHIMGREKSRMEGLYMLWNMVDGCEKTELYQVYEAVIKELDPPALKTFLPDTKRFRREQSASHRSVFRSTLFSADHSLIRGSSLDRLVDESIELLKQDPMSGKEYDDGLDVSFITSQARSRNRSLHPYTPEKEEKASVLSELSGEVASSSATKEEGHRRRGEGQDYERLFTRNAPFNTRSGKTVYIRKESRERTTRIVQVTGKNEPSLYSYLGNVLEQHSAAYQEEISELCKKRNLDIFQS